MPIFKRKPFPKELQGLMESAQRGEVSPIDYYKALTSSGLGDFEAIVSLMDTFGWSYDQAKELAISSEYGSTEPWAKDLCNAIDEVSKNHKPESAPPLET